MSESYKLGCLATSLQKPGGPLKGRKAGVGVDGPKDDRSQDAVVVCNS